MSLGQKPDGGPEPVSQRQLGFHLHLSVHESEASGRPVGIERGHGQSVYSVSDPALKVSTLSNTALQDSALSNPAFQDSVLSCIARLCAI